MAEIQQFNLGQLLSDAETIKGQRRQNRLGELLEPLKMQEAQLGLQTAQLGQTQQLARTALSILGDTPEQNWGQAIEFARQRGADLTGLEQYSPQAFEAVKQLASGGQQGQSVQFGAQQTLKDESGNLFFGTTRRNPQTGEVESVLAPIGGGNAAPVGRVSVTGQYGLTGGERVDLNVGEEGRKRDVNIARDMGQAAYKRAQVVGESLPAYDRAIELVESGQANTGRFANLLPTITAGTAELENVALQLGLSTIQAVTFGALSEKEMEAALASNIPTNLPPPELAEFLRNRRDGQRKLYRGLLKQAIDLSSGRKTLADIAEEADRNLAEMERKNGSPEQQPAPIQQSPTQGGIDSILNRYR